MFLAMSACYVIVQSVCLNMGPNRVSVRFLLGSALQYLLLGSVGDHLANRIHEKKAPPLPLRNHPACPFPLPPFPPHLPKAQAPGLSAHPALPVLCAAGGSHCRKHLCAALVRGEGRSRPGGGRGSQHLFQVGTLLKTVDLFVAIPRKETRGKEESGRKMGSRLLLGPKVFEFAQLSRQDVPRLATIQGCASLCGYCRVYELV